MSNVSNITDIKLTIIFHLKMNLNDKVVNSKQENLSKILDVKAIVHMITLISFKCIRNLIRGKHN